MFIVSPVKKSLCFCCHQSRIVCVYVFTSQEEFVFMFLLSPVKNSLCLVSVKKSLCFCCHQSRIVCVYVFTSLYVFTSQEDVYAFQEEFMFLLSPVKNSLCLCFHQSMTLCAYACCIQDHHVFIA